MFDCEPMISCETFVVKKVGGVPSVWANAISFWAKQERHIKSLERVCPLKALVGEKEYLGDDAE